MRPTWINHSLPLCDLKKPGFAMKQSLSILPVCAMEISSAQLSIMSEPSYLWGEHWGLSPHLPAPVTAKHSRNPASAIQVTDAFPSLIVLRIFPSPFFPLFIPHGSLEKWKQANTQNLTYLYVNLCSINLGSKEKLNPIISVFLLFYYNIYSYFRPKENLICSFLQALPHQDISHQL